jgi:hypothetical protein
MCFIYRAFFYGENRYEALMPPLQIRVLSLFKQGMMMMESAIYCRSPAVFERSQESLFSLFLLLMMFGLAKSILGGIVPVKVAL